MNPTVKAGHPLIGQVLLDTYRVEGVLGEGGMGTVLLARHVRLHARFALKLLRPEMAIHPEIFARFKREAEITSALNHPGIVRVNDFDRLPDGTHVLVMEHLEGEDLQRRLSRRGRIALEQALDIAGQVGAALHAAHRLGVVHRDLKPSNLFLCAHEGIGGQVESAKVLDFGISKMRDTGSLATSTGKIFGTPQYMSPEQARGENQTVDGRADQYALGVILYEALSGRQPFDANSPVAALYQVLRHDPPPLCSIDPTIPQAVSQSIARAMSKDKEARFPSMPEFVQQLQGARAIAETTRKDERAPRQGEQRRWALVMAGCLAVTAMLLAAGALGHLWPHHRSLDEHLETAPQAVSVPAVPATPEHPRPLVPLLVGPPREESVSGPREQERQVRPRRRPSSRTPAKQAGSPAKEAAPPAKEPAPFLDPAI